MNPAVKILGKVSISAEGVWDRNKEYEKLCLVYREVDNYSFLSKKYVPKGTDLSNTEYWQKVGVGGYKDNNIIVISDIDPSTGEVVRHTLESAINTISSIDRTPGLILSFYGVIDDSYNTLDWYLYQFKSNNIDEWLDTNNWVCINSSNNDIKVIDNLTSTNPRHALSANMGRVLADMISSITGFSTSVVTTLPLIGQSGVVYFVKNDSSTEEKNIYTEYVWLDSLGVYEALGEFTTTVDLNDFQTKLIPGENIKNVFGESILGKGNIALPIASDTDYGCVKLGYVATGNTIPVLKDINGKLYVSIDKSGLSKETIIDLLEYTPAKQEDVTILSNKVTTLDNIANNVNLRNINPINALTKTTIPGAPGVYKTTDTTQIITYKSISELGYSANKPFGKVIVPHGVLFSWRTENVFMAHNVSEIKELDGNGVDVYNIVYDSNSDSVFVDVIFYNNAYDIKTYGEWTITRSPSDQGTVTNPIILTDTMEIYLIAIRDVFIDGVSNGTETTSSINNKDEYRISYLGDVDEYINILKASDGKIIVSYKDTYIPGTGTTFIVILHNDIKNIHEVWYIKCA